MEKVKLKIGDSFVDCELLTVGEYIELTESRHNGTIKHVMPDIIYKRTGVVPRHLAEQAFIKLFLLSRDKQIKVNQKCACGEEHKSTLDPHSINVSPSKDLFFDFGVLKIKARYPLIFEDDDAFEMVSRCIEYVVVDGEHIEWSDVSPHEMDAVLEHLTFDDIKQMVNALLEPDIWIALPTCKEPVIVKGLQDMLRLC